MFFVFDAQPHMPIRNIRLGGFKSLLAAQSNARDLNNSHIVDEHNQFVYIVVDGIVRFDASGPVPNIDGVMRRISAR